MSNGAKITLWVIGSIATLGIGYFIYTKLTKGKSLGFSKINPDSANLLFIGDSLTAYSNSFADQFKKQYPNVNIKKIAIVGKQTSWMLPQLQQELSSGKKYDAITIWGGVNDIYATNSIGNAKSNLQQMYVMAKNSGAKVIALNVIPTATYKISNSKTTQLTNDLNSWINSNNTLDAIVDVNSLVSNGNNGTLPQFLQSDTLHLTDSAHSVIENDFAKKVIK